MAINSRIRSLLKVSVAVVVIACIAFAGYKLWDAKFGKSGDVASRVDAAIEDQTRASTEAYISDKDVLKLYDLIEDKKYGAVADKAKSLCPSRTGEMQLLCYSLHGQALMAENKLNELAVLSKEVLASESIRQNDVARIAWEHNLSKASQGINPKDQPLGGSDAEARE